MDENINTSRIEEPKIAPGKGIQSNPYRLAEEPCPILYQKRGTGRSKGKVRQARDSDSNRNPGITAGLEPVFPPSEPCLDFKLDTGKARITTKVTASSFSFICQFQRAPASPPLALLD